MSQTFWTAIGAVGTMAGVGVAIWVAVSAKSPSDLAPPKHDPVPPRINPAVPPGPRIDAAPQCVSLRLSSCDLNTDAQASNIINSCRAYLDTNPNDPAAYSLLGRANLALGRIDEAERQFETQLALGIKINDSGVIGAANFNLATVAVRKAALDRAETFVRKSLDMARGNATAEAANFKLLGDIYYKRNDFNTADAHFQRSANLQQVRDDKFGLGTALVGLGFSKIKNKDRAAGCSQLRNAQKIFTELSCTKAIRDSEKYLSETRCN